MRKWIRNLRIFRILTTLSVSSKRGLHGFFVIYEIVKFIQFTNRIPLFIALSIITLTLSFTISLLIGMMIAWKYFRDTHISNTNHLKETFVAHFEANEKFLNRNAARRSSTAGHRDRRKSRSTLIQPDEKENQLKPVGEPSNLSETENLIETE